MDIDSKLDRIAETLTDQAKILVRNTVTLEEHVRRTDLLEAKVEPLTEAHHRWVGAGKAVAAVGAVIGALASLAGVGELILHVLGHLR